MCKTIALMVAFMLALLSSWPALSAPDDVPKPCVEMGLPDLCKDAGEFDRWDKLGRGWLNLLFLPLEVPASIMSHREMNPVVGGALGLGELVLFRLKLRALLAVYDLVTWEDPTNLIGYGPITFDGRMQPYVFEPLLK